MITLHQPEGVSNTSSHDPPATSLEHLLLQATRGTGAASGTLAATIGSSAVGKSTVDVECVVRNARDGLVVGHRVQVARVRVVVAAALGVLLAKARDIARLVAVTRVVVVGVRVAVWVGVRAVEPEPGEDTKSCTAEDIWRDATARACAGGVGDCCTACICAASVSGLHAAASCGAATGVRSARAQGSATST